LLCTLKVSYTYGWVMRRESCPACIYIWMSHESWVMSCTWIRSESCCTSEWVMRHAWGMSHVPCMNGSRIMSYVWIRNESCPIYEFVLRHVWMRTARHDSWLMTHSYIYEWVTNHVLRMNSQRIMSYIWIRTASCVNAYCATWLMTHDSFIYIWMSHESCPTYEFVVRHVLYCTKSFLEEHGCRTRQPERTWLLGPGSCSGANQKYPFCSR